MDIFPASSQVWLSLFNLISWPRYKVRDNDILSFDFLFLTRGFQSLIKISNVLSRILNLVKSIRSFLKLSTLLRSFIKHLHIFEEILKFEKPFRKLPDTFASCLNLKKVFVNFVFCKLQRQG